MIGFKAGRPHHSAPVRSSFLTVLAIGLCAWPSTAQRLGPVKGFKVAEPYEVPHQTQLKFLLEGDQAEFLDNEHTLFTNPKLHTYRVTSEPELSVSAPQCLYDATAKSINSAGPLRVETADGKFSIEGQGFLWRETNSSLTISNQVHTVIQPGLLDASNPKTSNVKSNTGPVHIFSDHFTYEREPGLGVYLGHVQVVGTNQDLSMSGGILRVKLPVEERQLQTITAETNVVIDYGELHAAGQRADYSVSNGLARIIGHPTWRAAMREGGGNELVIDRTNRIFQANGSAWMKIPGASLGTSSFLLGTNSPPPASAAHTNQFVEIWSDRYEFRTNWGVFRERVRVRQREGKRDLRRMDCDKLTVTLAGTNELQNLVAEGSVIIDQDTNRLAGGKAVYTATNGLLELTQKPFWHAGLREGRGERIQLVRDEMAVRGNASMRLPADELAESGSTLTNQPHMRLDPAKFAEIYSQEYTFQTNRAVFLGGVYASHPQMSLACERLEVELGAGGGKTVTADQDVVFDLRDERGQSIKGRGDKAIYTVTLSGSATNGLLRLTGNPAMLQLTNAIVTHPIILLDRVTGDLSLPGPGYHLQGTAPALSTNMFVLPKPKFSK